MSNNGSFPGNGGPGFGNQQGPQGGSWQSGGQQYPPAGQQAGWGQQNPGQQPPPAWSGAPGQPTPYGQQQYPTQPHYAAQPQYGQGGPQQPWGYPPAQGQNQSPKKSNKAVLGVVGGVVGVALIGGTVYALGRPNPAPAPTVSTSGLSTPTVATAKASDVVSAYLRALGSGDSATALSLAATAPTDTTLLTDAVLAKTTAGKLTDISVPDVAGQATSVTATYSLNGKPVTATFAVTNVGGQYRMAQVAAEVELAAMADVPLKLAGVRPTGDVVSVFPGVYPVTPVNKYYSIGTVSMAVSDTEDVTPDSRTVGLSSAGKSAIVKAANAKWKACLKSHSLRPSGCGFGVRSRSGVKLITSSIKWTKKSGAKWSSAKFKLVAPGLAEAKSAATVHFYARDARVSGRYWFKDVKLQGVSALIGSSKVSVTFY
ncbi:hypothetical protein [Micropruina glycogenica]|uniref:Uncharacterized protein n=1 Tax=Micropruina glycogenica TaxID=75385 RepID=A0A2N9JFV1_9ACTN|nr:hypothetical protein [Micropruina glycogenica]SPD86994.1 conserved protein of unknown function [Micropruina glycogenica]